MASLPRPEPWTEERSPRLPPPPTISTGRELDLDLDQSDAPPPALLLRCFWLWMWYFLQIKADMDIPLNGYHWLSSSVTTLSDGGEWGKLGSRQLLTMRKGFHHKYQFTSRVRKKTFIFNKCDVISSLSVLNLHDWIILSSMQVQWKHGSHQGDVWQMTKRRGVVLSVVVHRTKPSLCFTLIPGEEIKEFDAAVFRGWKPNSLLDLLTIKAFCLFFLQLNR